MHRDIIGITGLEIDCVVGVHGHERRSPQRLRVDVAMALDTSAAGSSERLSRTVDYHQAASQIVFLMQSCRFKLLETAAQSLASLLLLPPLADEQRPQVTSVEVVLYKPDALDGVAVPSLRIERDVSWVRHARAEASFGTAETVHETPDVGIFRLSLAPGKRVTLPRGGKGRESDMVLGEGMTCEGRPTASGSIFRWPEGEPRTYENRSDRTLSLICVEMALADGG